NGDNILYDIVLFSKGCDSHAEYRRVEDDRRRLQAVCRHWKAITDDLAINLAVTEFEAIVPILERSLNLAQRIEIPITTSQDGGADAPAYKPLPDPPFSLECAQVISWSSLNAFNQYIDARHINSAPNLKALRVHMVQLKNITLLDNLTYLSILDISGEEVPATFSLPRLRYLYLRLRPDRVNTESPHRRFDHWSFPQITSLCISGYATMELHQDGLPRLIHAHTHTLENLVLVYKITVGFIIHIPTINVHELQQCRRLKVLGLNLKGVKAVHGADESSNADTPPPPLALLLKDISSLPALSDTETIARQCLSLCNPPTAIFNRIVMVYSWQEIFRKWENQSGDLSTGVDSFDPLESPRKFFKVLYEANVRFFDREGVELREGEVLQKLGLTNPN
ncbi:hypothetical protein FRC16_007248, partial [Serendipita sp. 398]